MDKRPILFLDSGIGGIPYCRDFRRCNPAETICYCADRRNFPYGSRERTELTVILTTIMEKLIKTINPKIAVLACNTASVSALAELRQCFPDLPFVGTVPAIKPAILASKTGIVGVLGTARTIEDPYIRELAAASNAGAGCETGACEIIGIAAPELVTFVEQRFFLANENEKNKIVNEYIDRFRAAGADTMVLGCTHFLFLLEEFKKEAAPFLTVFGSIEGITKRIESLLDDNNGVLRTENNASHQNRLLLSGTQSPNDVWQNMAEQLDCSVSLLDEL
ncbi:MAG: glutamate racemase [Treponema sp.]|nr:glutamate racemase [Treponema sp.]